MYDYQYYRRIGELSLQGYYPSLNYWLEYPPVFSWLIVGIYRLSLLLPAMRDPIFWFHNFLGSFLTLVDAGNLALIYGIGCRLHGRVLALRASWMYALLFWPLYVMLGWFDAVPLLFMLATVYGVVTNRPIFAGLAAGLGFMAKLIPAVVAPVALRALASNRQRVICALTGLISVTVIAAPFLLLSPKFFLAGFQSALTRSSWETIWALIEGYFDVGIMPPLEAHFDLATATMQTHPSTLPWSIIMAIFAVAYLAMLSRVRRGSVREIVAFSALALTLLLLFSKGYSDQFIVYLLPFVILMMPNGWGVAFAVLLSLTNVLEYPLFAMVFPKEQWVLWTAVTTRTLLLVVLCVVYCCEIVGGAPVWLAKVRNRVAMPAFAAAMLAVIGLAWPLLSTFVAGRGEYYDLQQYLRPLAVPGQGVVLSTRDLIGYTYPFLDGAEIYVLPDKWEQQKDQAAAEVRAFAARSLQVWLVLDYLHGEDARQGFLERTLDSYGAKSTNRWFDTFRLIGYVPQDGGGGEGRQKETRTLGQMLRLEGYNIKATVDDGSPFRVMMRWRSSRGVDSDYSLFVHLVSGNGAVVAQRDKVLSRFGAATKSWQIGDELQDASDILVPVGTPPGVYEVRAGLYRADSGVRLKDESGGDSITLGKVRVTRAVSQRPPRLAGAPLALSGGLRLLGYEVGSPLRAGEDVPIAVYFESGGLSRADFRLGIALVRDKALVVQSEELAGGNDYPPGKWRAGEIVRDLRKVGAVEVGRYQVGVKLLGNDVSPSAQHSGASSLPGGWVLLPGEVVVEK